MVDLQTLSLLLSINETQMVQDLVSTVMSSPQVSQFMHEHPLFFKNVQEHVQQWSQSIPAQLKNIPVPDDLQQEYILYLDAQGLSAEQFTQQSADLLVQLQHSDFHTDAQNLLLTLSQANAHNRKQLFIQKWREHLVSQVLSLEIIFAEQERERMLQNWNCACRLPASWMKHWHRNTPVNCGISRRPIFYRATARYSGTMPVS